MRRSSLNPSFLMLAFGLGGTLGGMALADEIGAALFDTGSSDTGVVATDDTGSAPAPDTGSAPAPDTGSAPGADTGDDTGDDDTGDDTGDEDSGMSGDSGGEPADDTGEPEPNDDTGSGDTGLDIPEDTGGKIGLSASELAGEKGGCGCAAQPSPVGAVWWLGLLGLLGLRRRR
jgi:MYXO-CTERM domain-containing protein